MKKVLIALDYNRSAQKIAETGYGLAKAMGAEVTLVHVIADAAYYSTLDYSPVMGYTGFSSPEMVPLLDMAELQNASKNFLEQSKAHLGDEAINTVVTEGDCAEAIMDLANELPADIIVLGTHSRRGLEKILMGSISEKIFHHTKIPLFIIPTKEEAHG
jgi:nucleotide-binding universal stress UspA family protein